MRFPVFVVGVPRSGTTLLSAMLDAHPDVAVSPETHFYTRCRGAAVEEKGRESVEQIWQCVQQQPGFGDAGFTREEVARMEDAIFGGSGRPRPADVLAAVERVYADRSGASAWGEKTPDHLQHVPDVFADFPDAVVVAIVRDPRDVCLSLHDLPWNRDTLLESAWTWRASARRTQRYRGEYPNRFRMVRYEDLLDTPAAVLHDVLRWLEAPGGPDVIDRMLHFHESDAGPADADREPWKEKTRRPIDPSNREKWRGTMPAAKRWLVQTVTGRYLHDFGYPAPPVRVDAAFGRDLLALLARTLRTIATRAARNVLSAPRRREKSYRPDWIERSD